MDLLSMRKIAAGRGQSNSPNQVEGASGSSSNIVSSSRSDSQANVPLQSSSTTPAMDQAGKERSDDPVQDHRFKVLMTRLALPANRACL
jgi:hypothetical protein